jgi:hypothetical protein
LSVCRIEAGERAAAMYSLIGSKLNGLDPEAYCRVSFATIPINRIEELLLEDPAMSHNGH